jgi:predicted amidohydrolase YtcJ
MAARKLFFNGKIFTSVRDEGLQEAMLIEDDRVLCVGREADLQEQDREVSRL